MQPFYVSRSSYQVIVSRIDKKSQILLCFHTQVDVFFQTKFHSGMKFYSFHSGMTFTSKYIFFSFREAFMVYIIGFCVNNRMLYSMLNL